VTYAIVTAILVLALIAVVIAVVLDTEDEPAEENVTFIVPPPSVPYVGVAPHPTVDVAPIHHEETQAGERRVVDVPEDVDRDSRPIGL
jgi:hypothetical protein